MGSSVIFIGSPEKNSSVSGKKTFKNLLCVPPYDLLFRIYASFVPPLGQKYQKVYVDFLGPLLATVFLAGFLNYGYSFKTAAVFKSPTESLLFYLLAMPVLCFMLCRVASSAINFSETVSVIGYGLYGHIFTLLVSFLCFQEQSNFFFFLCLVFFGGSSTLRMMLIFLKTIPQIGARFLICTVISVLNVLYLIFLHFGYMHRTFNYRGN